MRKFISVALFVFVLRGTSSALAAGGVLSGRERDIWSDGEYFVILAQVKAIKAITEPDAGTHEVKFEPLATLAGHFDPSDGAVLLARMYARRPETSSIADVPPVGSLVLAVIVHSFIAGDPKRPCISVTSMWCTFMPGESSLVVIDGLADKRVIETLAKIRDARAHPNK